MSVLDPTNTTVNDLCVEALKLSGRLGIGQVALAEDLSTAWAYFQWMLQQWQRKRWHVYRIVNLSKISTGSITYTMGPGGDIDTGADTVRPARVDSAFIRMVNVSPPNQPDWAIEILQSRQDYDRIRLKNLTTLSSVLWYDPSWPLGTIYTWPIAQANIYEIHVSVLFQLPNKFANSAVVLNLPYEYYWAIVTNLAMVLRGRYGLGTYPGDIVPGAAKDAIGVFEKANVAIPRLVIPADLTRNGGSGYNIFGDCYNQ